ncbi:hypothetical protein OCU04_003199 [Sclerotinia nivalis]|uniref:Uncharacterized protein n=1 Tax=Sclerotinia nivalis TaxID=352851 RepID=A0A9X0AVU1_9HELO|nr:hypothetical protein OCU04_003199 [Sclerotinia nivalis]
MGIPTRKISRERMVRPGFGTIRFDGRTTRVAEKFIGSSNASKPSRRNTSIFQKPFKFQDHKSNLMAELHRLLKSLIDRQTHLGHLDATPQSSCLQKTFNFLDHKTEHAKGQGANENL